MHAEGEDEWPVGKVAADAPDLAMQVSTRSADRELDVEARGVPSNTSKFLDESCAGVR